MINRKAQVWVETVLYTLIGLALIGVVLAFVMPKINSTKDKLAVEQTTESLNTLASTMDIIPGNVRIVDFTMKRGSMTIDSPNDRIIFLFDDLSSPYSEIGQKIPQGQLVIETEKGQKYYSVTLTLDLKGKYDIRYKDENVTHKFTASSVPYKIQLTAESADNESAGLEVMSIDEIS